MTLVWGKSSPLSSVSYECEKGTFSTKQVIASPHMSSKRRTALEILAENIEAHMAQPGNEAISTGPLLAAKAKLDRKTVYNLLEKRHYPRLDQIEKLARALRIEPYLLMCPAVDQQFATICQAYSVAPGDREYLVFSAKAILEKHGRDQAGEAESA